VITAPGGGREPSWGAAAVVEVSDGEVEEEAVLEEEEEAGTELYFWKMYASASSN
jgi:hypothetical protein